MSKRVDSVDGSAAQPTLAPSWASTDDKASMAALLAFGQALVGRPALRGGRVKCNVSRYSQLTDLTVDKNKAKTSMRE